MKNSYLTRRFEESIKRNIEDLPLAPVWDRVAAFVVDILIVSFIANILLSPVRKKIQASVLTEHDGATNFYVICIILGASAVFILYHAISIFLFQKTIGKKVFKLEVASIVHGQRFTITNSLVRAVSLYFSILFFCFPFLEVFSNKLRRPFHDRVSDSYVKGLEKVGESPSPVEKLWVRLVYVVVMANVALVLAAQFFFLKQDIQNLSEFVTEPEYLCDEVTDAKETWPEKDKASRLDIALTLYGADVADNDCLEKESNRALSYAEELDKAYLAKAFLYENDVKLSDKYLKKACELNSNGDACTLTEVIKEWSDKDWKAANETLANHKTTNPFIKIWAIKHYSKTQDYEKVIELADSLWPNVALNDFVGKYRTLTLWKLDKISESQELFKSTYGHLGEESKINFVSEVCNLEIERGCSSNSCKLLVEEMKQGTEDSFKEDTLLTYIKTNKCGMTEVDDIIAEFRTYMDDPKLQMYLAAVKAQNLGKNEVAGQIYKNILKTASATSLLSYESRSNLFETLKDEELADQTNWWLTADVTGDTHHRLGVKLLKILSEKKKWQVAEPIATKLMSATFKSREQSELMAVVFYNLQKFNVAKSIIKSMRESTRRDVASESEFEKIKMEMGEK